MVYFEFRPDGNYRGYSFYFASGNGCGYCGGNMGITSTIKLAGGRLKGSVKGTDTDRKFDVTLDLPITSDDHGAPLPADGGAPGKAYRDYHDALVKGDAKALQLVLPDEQRENLAKAIKDRQDQGVPELPDQGAPHPVRQDHQGLEQRQGGGDPVRRRVERAQADRRSHSRQRGRHLAR